MTFDAWWEVNWQAVTTVNSEYRREDCRVVWDAATAQATAAERERCAKIAEEHSALFFPNAHAMEACGKIAAAIRAEP